MRVNKLLQDIFNERIIKENFSLINKYIILEHLWNIQPISRLYWFHFYDYSYESITRYWHIYSNCNNCLFDLKFYFEHKYEITKIMLATINNNSKVLSFPRQSLAYFNEKVKRRKKEKPPPCSSPVYIQHFSRAREDGEESGSDLDYSTKLEIY